jgi:proline dehydrogenase
VTKRPALLLRRSHLYRLATSDRVERAARAFPAIERRCYTLARRYIAGTSLEDAVAVVKDLREQGMSTSVDLFGEGVTDTTAIQAVVERYLQAASRLSALDCDAYLEVVPSHIGLDISPNFLRQRLEQIIEALPSGSRLEVSAEESRRTERILRVILELAREGAPVIATLQANLRRSEVDAERLADAGVSVRLVKGAYLEPPDVAHRWGDATDLAFVRLAHTLHAAGVELSIGTHDPVIREALLASLEGTGVEMLLGVRPDDARELVRRGHRVRIYVPFGDRWFRYWMRRVAEAARV